MVRCAGPSKVTHTKPNTHPTDDGEERAPSPAPKAGAAKATPAPASAQPKVVPGAAPKGGRGARYPARGGPRNVYREERPAEGGEGFEGERVGE